jgi:hypothetical protein
MAARVNTQERERQKVGKHLGTTGTEYSGVNPMAATRANKIRQERQEALREMLSKKCTVQHVIENIRKMEEQGPEMEAQELTALKYATETRLKLISKYLPDLKSQEITGEAGEALQVTVADFSSANKHSE